jgi:cyclopropane fatty-acyl-phospholipid synthase-like methyltransferase
VPPEGFLDEKKVAEFWDRARQAAEADQQTGYLQDEWPSALGANRFAGEWRDVAAWLDALAVPRGACLDVGCGVGVWLERLAGRFERAEGVDLSGEMVASARARLAAAGVTNATVEKRSILELPDDRRYDLVFVGGVLMYVNDEDLERMVARLARLLTPRGLLLLRESTSAPEPWYRDTPLSPGLHADRAAKRPPYFAIYRTPESYRRVAEAHGLEVVRAHPNRHYKLADMTETWLRVLDTLSRGALARRRGAAERAARAIHALRALTLVPQYHLVRTLAPRVWKLDNWWFACRPRQASLAPPRPGVA